MPKGIIIFGGNGCGKSTLGREVAKALSYKFMDIEDYFFVKSEILYSVPRSREECYNLMLKDIEKYKSFVITTVNGDCGEEINNFYECAVYMTAPLEVRLDRVKKRSYEQFGERMRYGGDLYEKEKKFYDFVASRSLSQLDEFAETLKCPVIRVDAAKPVSENLKYVLTQYKELT